MQRFHSQLHIKWWRIIGWLYLTGLLIYGFYTILTSLSL